METKRTTAIKVRIGDIVSGDYIKKAGWDESYMATQQGTFSRANVIGIIVAKEGQSFVIDDGTGSMQLRLFEQPSEEHKIGDCVIVIGRIRQYENDTYLVPEIMRPIDSKWLDVRKIETASNISSLQKTVKETVTAQENLFEKTIALIRCLDNGEGAEFDRVAEKLGNKDAESIIKTLLEEGEVFQIKPGKLKLLD